MYKILKKYPNLCVSSKGKKSGVSQQGANKSMTFSFDRCYNPTSSTADVYNEVPYSLVQVKKTVVTKSQSCPDSYITHSK